MQLELFRVYFPGGTNGIVYLNGLKVCNTIELPRKGNQQSVSCIPEGIYQLAVRHSPKLDWHLHLHDVPGREWILIHPANYAIGELKGCIAPVSMLTGPGRGICSRNAMERLRAVTSKAFAAGEPVFLNIKKHEDETI